MHEFLLLMYGKC